MNDTYITFTGWVGGDVTLSEVGAGHQVATFRVGSTPRRLVNGVWEDSPTNWFTVKAWRQLAVNVAHSVRRGDPVVVHGRLTADVWEKPDGQTSVRHLVIATSVGHDLGWGASQFRKSLREGSSPSPMTAPDGAREQRVPAPAKGEAPAA